MDKAADVLLFTEEVDASMVEDTDRMVIGHLYAPMMMVRSLPS